MASHRLNPLYAIKECSTCGSLYTRDCCSIGSLEDKILTPKFKEDLITYCVENGIFQDSQDTFESSDDNTNVVNAPREPIVVNQDPGVKSSQDPPQIDQNCCYECGDSLDGIFCRQCICKSCGKDPSCFSLPHVSKPNLDNDPPNVFNQPPQPQFEAYLCELCGNNVHYGYDCSPQFTFVYEQEPKVRKKEQAYEEEKYSAARRYMLSIPLVDEDDYIPLGDIIAQNSTSKAITSDLPIEEPDNSLNMGDENLVPTPSIENLVPIPSEFEGMSDDTSDVPTCDNNCVNVESDFVESLINRDTSIVYSSKIDPILEEFVGELAHIAPIPPGIVEADFDPNDDISSDDDSFENIEYVDASPSYIEYDSFEEVNDVEQEEKEFDLEDIFQIQDVILREKLLNVHRLISNIESLKVLPFPILLADSGFVLESLYISYSQLDNILYPNSRLLAIIRKRRVVANTNYSY
ncbi:hypothetical protein Tco_0127303 [Tanacetum coccineum]